MSSSRVQQQRQQFRKFLERFVNIDFWSAGESTRRREESLYLRGACLGEAGFCRRMLSFNENEGQMTAPHSRLELSAIPLVGSWTVR